MVIENNKETHRFIETAVRSLSRNMLLNKICSVVDNKIITASQEKELVKLYNKAGINTKTLKYDARELTENPYYKNIRLQEINTSNITYSSVTLPKRACIRMGFTRYSDELYGAYIDMGYFDKAVDIPRLMEGDTLWMSPTIAEQRSIQPHINMANGKVLTFGLGIGYYAYMCLLKDEVSDITIVEINKNIIDLFNKYIRPQFPDTKRINIIHGDMYEYYNEEFMGSFDSVFVDTWCDNTDGLNQYKKLQQVKVDRSNISYWIEESILEDIKLSLLIYIREVLVNRYTESLKGLSLESRKDINGVHRYFQDNNKVYKSYNQLKELVNNVEILRDIAGYM